MSNIISTLAKQVRCAGGGEVHNRQCGGCEYLNALAYMNRN